MTSLLDKSCFSLLFDDLADKSIGFLPLDGNVGDQMIQRASRELFQAYNIDFYDISTAELHSGKLSRPIDEIVVSGGGNMGKYWAGAYLKRKKVLQFNVPITIFPQSFPTNDEEISRYKKVFVRELASKAHNSQTILAPDTALAMEIPDLTVSAVAETGIFLRKDKESLLADHPDSLLDPVLISNTIDEYLQLAALFETIITDRLHFAIAGLMAKRQVFLLPNAYHKNRSMYDTWLQQLGCGWLDNIKPVPYGKQQTTHLLWKRLGGAPSEILAWNSRPILIHPPSADRSVDADKYFSSVESYDHVNLNQPDILNSLLTGTNSIEDIVTMISHYFPERIVSIALDIQKALKHHAVHIT